MQETKPFLYQPVSPWKINQRFGENRVCTNGKKQVMCNKDGTCPVGFKPLYKQYGLDGHNGADCMAKRWQPVYCGAEGKVLKVETEIERGLGVEVITKVGNKYFKHNYWHLIALNVHEGESAEVGTLLGYADSTGLSTGDHLHFGLKECKANGMTLNTNNGYKGALNPEDYLIPKFSLEAAPIIKKIKETMALLIDALSDQLRK